ncbi:glutathione peroxidase [Undibacterium fentianense]|uniref:Glutathione peroxidase n=1 Tax=Undibacterium fentianense TaxID=2828728 RepID=A0A941E226_9BURK|nr:glutathione peroxidase [Undibacterium fentianense]MBR7800930.1 glutathione peroxidase [Undibacterium fentianense]
MSAYDFEASTITGRGLPLREFLGQVSLIVNTASACGFTDQYHDLEAMYRDFRASGFTVLGFPCNQFGAQEPGDGDQIATFCQRKFGLSFPLFDKIHVNGKQTHPLFQYLKTHAPGILGTKAIKWNFTKFLVDQDGHVVRRYAPTTRPEDIRSDIQQLLNKNRISPQLSN